MIKMDSRIYDLCTARRIWIIPDFHARWELFLKVQNKKKLISNNYTRYFENAL